MSPECGNGQTLVYEFRRRSKNMEGELNTKLPQAGSSSAVNPVHGSYQEKDRVAVSGRADSGGDQIHFEQKTSTLPRIVVTPARLDVTKSRRFSTTSVAELKSPHDSISDVSSVDSAATTKHYNTWKKQANEDLAFLKKALQEALECCTGEVRKMENASLIQKNYPRTSRKAFRC